ncbi:hypothetical protein N9F44_02525 [Akkermansiaceae bacterium]|nr:hypothetical protein [Akkermansiaceae bacterium]MDA8975863.1 hypothetical protein [Akkermansiaceae bacterium]MDB4319561.1 hypothetical protein [bacterium]MDB4332069.1 hypothetical protein [Akkermansiaceae bacterium]MDB4615652.1 hypothetical protein [Akkermansiaceae bacterium]
MITIEARISHTNSTFGAADQVLISAPSISLGEIEECGDFRTEQPLLEPQQFPEIFGMGKRSLAC